MKHLLLYSYNFTTNYFTKKQLDFDELLASLLYQLLILLCQKVDLPFSFLNN